MKSDLEISPDNEVLNSLSKETPQTPTACQGETEQSLTNLDKVSTSSRSRSSQSLLQTVLNICCEHCQKRKKPPVARDQIANMADPEEFFCCKKAWKLSEMLPKGAVVITKETISDRGLAKQKGQRLKGLEAKRSLYRQTPKAGQHASATLHSLLSEDPWTVRNEASFPEIEIIDSGNMFSFSSEVKGETPLVKNYDSGQTFIVIFPDGTGQMYYPSGRLAILISAAQEADCSCVVVLEDNQQQPRIQAVFVTRGQGTCYHNNGCMWVNLTPWEGTYYGETGDLKKHWSWLDTKHHVHAPPYQPLCLTLSPKLNIRIQSQEHIFINFTSDKYSIQLNVGVKLKLNQGKGLMLQGPDMFQRYLQEKSAEINVLLQNIQSLITYQKTVSPQKVKPQQSLISQMERQQLPVKQQQSAKKTP
ncbi:glutamate-rich protein 6-like [Anabas testudineus]|uniref:FAM194 C-terminal domain-containing protein n=1 Tax=Anabas testudineus TaxID=64144 RepID=A0AAQ6IDC3_ANATE|nr:glutamate-rich protein 6-like [Anabas testudineus]